ncbi:MAG: sigma-54 dependent transcriptional regulator [Oligoflexia bacterium]|nr:sigma-54 dependent transcriptional regulator [Oligoflexia bacterium]
MTKARILVVDDEDTIRKLLKARLEREGYDVAVASQAEEAQAAFASGGDVGVLVTDLRMPGKDGFALMDWAKKSYPHLRVIVITGHGEKEVAVKALRQGAADYLEKPFDLDELSHSVKRCLNEYRLEHENTDLVARLEARAERVEGKSEDKLWYVSKSPAMGKVNEWVTILRREAMRGGGEELPVLILGQSGTGKEGIARMVHAGSRRGKGPWVAVNCANFNEQLLESELFGHERGAFTGANALKRGLFELAKGGTLFLDEIGEMDVKLQAKLLRVLQEKVFRRVGGTADLETDVRVIAATNQNLQARVKAGSFREDLYHRINGVVIDVPALAERTDDIVPMATQFAERAFRARGKAFGGFSPEAEAVLRDYAWPGNVRELLNVMERTALIWEGAGALTAKALSIPGAESGAATGGPRLELVRTPIQAEEGDSYTELKKKWADAFEREYLVSILVKFAGNVSAAAREAKIDRSNFLRLLRRHGLTAEAYRTAATKAQEAAPAKLVA